MKGFFVFLNHDYCQNFHDEHIIKTWNGDKVSNSAMWSHIEAWGIRKKSSDIDPVFI